MNTSYDRIAGHSVERLAALSDGIFGVAMTLLLLDLHVPARDSIQNEAALRHALLLMFPQLLVYLMSFITLGIFWVGQQTHLNHLKRSDRHLTWIHLAFLFSVTLLPFSTRLLTNFMAYRAALLVYWGNIFLFGAILYAGWRYAARASLNKDDMPELVKEAICHRIIIGQGLYAFGALLCVFSTYLSIGFIVLVQIYFAVSPRTWQWRRNR